MSILYAKFYFSSFSYKVKYTRVYFSRYIISNICDIVLLCARYYIYIILLCGDVKLNPGPKLNSSKCFSICHWNLNSITSHSFIKVSLLSAYNVVHNFAIICISESYLNSHMFTNDDKLSIPGYMLRADHPSDNRRGGVCVYYKESLPIRLYNISYFQECICFNLMISNKLCNIVSLYRSPSQNSAEFENFINNLNLTLESIIEKNPF